MINRFWEKVDKTDTCWLWSGAKILTGYGHFRFHKKVKSAHRVSWELAHGPIPNGACVCHRCDNPACVNPDHLFLGTHHQNMKDRNQKLRQAFGEKNGKTFLTSSEITEIRRLYCLGISQPDLAKQFNMHRTNICRIVNNKRRVYE